MSTKKLIAHYRARPPSILAPFKCRALPVPRGVFDGHGEPVQSYFRVDCACGVNAFEVEAYADDDEDEQAICDPYALECSSCAKRYDLFDQRKHGYDGSLGHWKSLEYPNGASGFITNDYIGPGPYRLAIRFEYTSDLLVEDIFNDWRGREQDLFSWMSIVAIDRADRPLRVLIEEECA